MEPYKPVRWAHSVRRSAIDSGLTWSWHKVSSNFKSLPTLKSGSS
jgi:hypothetical protein